MAGEVSVTTEDGTPSIRLNISGRTVYAALKNLLRDEYKITPLDVKNMIMSSPAIKETIDRFLSNSYITDLVKRAVGECVRALAPDLIREVARETMNGKIKITVG